MNMKLNGEKYISEVRKLRYIMLQKYAEHRKEYTWQG